MKSRINVLLLITGLLQVTACEQTDIENQSFSNFETEQSYLVALERLAAAKMTPDFGWSESATIVERYPIYLAGIDEPSYYEYKVESDGKDAGYILVNVNQTDILIPELTTSGRTLTERYYDELNQDNFKIYRYNYFESTAKTNNENGEEEIIAVYGVNANPSITLIGDEEQLPDSTLHNIWLRDKSYAEKVESSGVIPWIPHEALNDYYSNVEPLTEDSIKESVDLHYEQIQISTKKQWALKHKFSNGLHMPKWWQIKSGGGYPLGCGGIAWGMLYSYWHQFKNTKALFNFKDLEPHIGAYSFQDTFVESILWEIAREYLDTTYATNPFGAGEEFGMVPPWRICDGKNYAKDLGYKGTTCHKEDVGPYDKFNVVSKSMREDRPAILYIHSDGIGVADHWVTVGATQRFYKWGPDALGYKVNKGGGGNHETWIYDLNGEPDYSVFDAITVNVPQKELQRIYVPDFSF